MSKKLEGKVAVITGGSSGIGQHAARVGHLDMRAQAERRTARRTDTPTAAIASGPVRFRGPTTCACRN